MGHVLSLNGSDLSSADQPELVISWAMLERSQPQGREAWVSGAESRLPQASLAQGSKLKPGLQQHTQIVEHLTTIGESLAQRIGEVKNRWRD